MAVRAALTHTTLMTEGRMKQQQQWAVSRAAPAGHVLALVAA
jgi:hypothetical protein